MKVYVVVYYYAPDGITEMYIEGVWSTEEEAEAVAERLQKEDDKTLPNRWNRKEYEVVCYEVQGS